MPDLPSHRMTDLDTGRQVRTCVRGAPAEPVRAARRARRPRQPATGGRPVPLWVC
jgi:hypothetical protein